MGVFFGGGTPFFRFRLNSETADPRVISAESSVPSNFSVLDSTKNVDTVTTASLGDQFLITSITEKFLDDGETPVTVYTSSSEAVATIDAEGNVTHVSDGGTTITGTATSTRFGDRVVTIDLTLSTTGGDAVVTTSFTPDTIDVTKNVLVVWNTNEADSTTAKNYYVANRPGMGSVLTLGIACTTTGTDGFESITQSNYETQIRDNIVSEINTQAGSSNYIRYIILMYGMPSRVSSNGNSVSYQLTRAMSDTANRTGTSYQNGNNNFSVGEYQGMAALVTSLNMGTLTDVQTYIDKLATVHGNMQTPNVIISGSDALISNDNYYFDDKSRVHTPQTAGNAMNLLLAENGAAGTTYGANSGDTSPTPDQTSHITSGSNVAGYMTWGANGGQGGSYANNGSVSWSGDSNWWIIVTVESFNNRRSTGQGNMIDWFSTDAFGGTSYSNTPVFGVGHVEEPFLSGVNDGMFFALWERGWLTIEAAWQSRNTTKFQAIGDPLIKR